MRRETLKITAQPLSATKASTRSTLYAGPVVDAHIHLFDPSRPGGVPWPPGDDTVLYRPTLPERYAAQSAPFGIAGAIAVEASPLASDNQWLLNVARSHPLMVGMIGNLVPGAANYMADLERLRGDPLFLGIRYGNLWNRDLAADLENPGFIAGLKALAAAGLVLESANPNARLIHALVEVAERVPGLRMVIDHLPNAPIPADADERSSFWADLRLLAASPRIFVKLSEIPVRANGKLVTDPHAYRAHLDAIWDVFGADRLLFGSDWPNSDHVATYEQTFSVVRSYMARKDPAVQQKFFWKNSIAAYKWRRRRREQPAL